MNFKYELNLYLSTLEDYPRIEEPIEHTNKSILHRKLCPDLSSDLSVYAETFKL